MSYYTDIILYNTTYSIMFNQSVKAIIWNSAPEPAKNTEENTEPHTQQQQAMIREAGMSHDS